SQPPEAAPPHQDTKVAKSDDKQAPAKSKDCKAAEANADTKPANTDDALQADAEAADESAAKVVGKKVAKPVGDVGDVGDVGHGIQAKADPEPDAGQKTDDAGAAAPAVADVVTVATVAAVGNTACTVTAPPPTQND